MTGETMTYIDPYTGEIKNAIYVEVRNDAPPINNMKAGSQINSALKSLGANSTALTFSPSPTPPTPGVQAEYLTDSIVGNICVAWREGNDIKYYARGYTDFSPVRGIPLNADSSRMFKDCTSLTIIDLSGFDTRNVTDMNNMFYNCNGLQQLDVSGFDTRNVTDMSLMFLYCGSLHHLDVSKFDTRNVTNMKSMFAGCQYLEDITGLDHFNTQKVTDMSGMFYFCTAITWLDLSNFDTNLVTDMSSMFKSDNNLATIYASASFVITPSLISNDMFNGCTNLQGDQGTSYNGSYPKDSTYAHLDGGASDRGYFSVKP